MKFSVLNPTEENIRETLLNDKLGRNEELRQFVRLLNSIDGNCTIALDGDWGSGKTFFVKQAQMIIDSFNEYKNKKAISEKDKENIKMVKDNFSDLGIKLQATAYYDAWENDNEDDPLLSILFSIINTVDCDKDFFKQDKPTALFKSITNTITTKAFGISSKNFLETLSGEDIFKDLKQHKTLRENVTEFLNELIPVGSKRLVIFIDELDRCKPSYAVKMLERIKHFFSNENIIFVFAINSFELQNTIKQYYGSSFNAYQYLDRFFDLRVELKDIDINKFIETQGIWTYNEYDQYMDICYSANRAIAKYFKFKMRTIDRFFKQVKILQNNVLQKRTFYNTNQEYKAYCFLAIFVTPILVALKLYNINDYRELTNGNRSELFIEICRSYHTSEFIKDKFNELLRLNTENNINNFEDQCLYLYNYLFKDNPKSFYKRIGLCQFTDNMINNFNSELSILSRLSNFE